MPNSYGDYYTTKGTGSQEVYDANYEDYGDSQVWAHLNTTSIHNTANIVNPDAYVTTHDAILETGIERLDAPKPLNPFLLIAGFLAYSYL
jgi:hypothetical protein